MRARRCRTASPPARLAAEARLARPDEGLRAVAHLGLAPKTIRNHVSNIFAKLQVRDRAEAIVRAREAGLGS